MAFWQIFQRAADSIGKWDFPPDIKKKLQGISDALPANIAKLLADKVLWLNTTCMKKYGKYFVQQVFKRII